MSCENTVQGDDFGSLIETFWTYDMEYAIYIYHQNRKLFDNDKECTLVMRKVGTRKRRVIPLGRGEETRDMFFKAFRELYKEGDIEFKIYTK